MRSILQVVMPMRLGRSLARWAKMPTSGLVGAIARVTR